MGFTRRFFLKSSGIAAVGLGGGLGVLPGFLTRAAATGPGAGRKTLVVLFQRGAVDGLNVVVPHGEPAYYAARPSIAIPPPRRGAAGTALDLDGFFGLHPALAPLLPLYTAGTLAVIQGAGSPDATRSHFDAQDFMESGTPGHKSTRDGWLNRYLQGRPTTGEESDAFRAVSLTATLPRILRGAAPALALQKLSDFDLPRFGDWVRQGLASVYDASGDPLLAGTARETFEAIEFLKSAEPGQQRPANGARYPGGPVGRSLQQVAQLIRASVGLEIAFVEVGGWDHHINEGGVEGTLASMLDPFARAIAAFVRDMGSAMNEVVLLTLSEFGRTVRENGNRGTDHGHATAMMVLGGGVQGGRVLGSWPGLAPEALHDGRDLALTTDFRDVVGQILQQHLGARRLDRVFPGHRQSNETIRGLVGSG